MSGLADALKEPKLEPKTEDSNYEGDADFDQDLDMDEKRGADDDEPMSPQQDTEMEDLFGDDKLAEEVTHPRSERYAV